MTNQPERLAELCHDGSQWSLRVDGKSVCWDGNTWAPGRMAAIFVSPRLAEKFAVEHDLTIAVSCSRLRIENDAEEGASFG